jgi:lysophospholipase L1-like esterase
MKRILSFIALLLVGLLVQAQPFADEIQAFKKQDSLHFPPRSANLFVGSSSLRLWKNIESDFSGYKVINRGFGGSSLPDVIRYAPDIIFPYDPKQVIIYCGENDFAASDTVTAETVAGRFIQLFEMIRGRWPKMPVAFISIKPSPSRAKLIPKMVEANHMIRYFLSLQKHTKFIDVYSLMLTRDGKPREELFGPDMLHMNADGYAIWKKAIKPVLKK